MDSRDFNPFAWVSTGSTKVRIYIYSVDFWICVPGGKVDMWAGVEDLGRTCMKSNNENQKKQKQKQLSSLGE